MNRVTYAITGCTGQLGSTVLYELLKRHAKKLEGIRIVCFVRGLDDDDARRRVVRQLHGWGRHYIGVEEVSEVTRFARPIRVVGCELREPDLGLSDAARYELSSYPIDHVIHCASLTDFRSKAHVAARLHENNVLANRNFLRWVGALEKPPSSYSYISSAYSCGLQTGKIGPTATDFEQDFQNPYQFSKLVAEVDTREFFKRRKSWPTALRIFRPTVLAGRTEEAVSGFVTKYDVFLGWALHFLRAKMEILAGHRFSQVLQTPASIPVRIMANAKAGLNIVPTDFAAKLIVGAALQNASAGSFHIAAERALNYEVLIGRILERLLVDGWTITRSQVRPNNPHEEAYYNSVGGLYTSYMNVPEPQLFDVRSMKKLCNELGLEPRGIVDETDLDICLDYAFEQNFGLELPSLLAL